MLLITKVDDDGWMKYRTTALLALLLFLSADYTRSLLTHWIIPALSVHMSYRSCFEWCIFAFLSLAFACVSSLLPSPTAAAGIWLSRLFVCMSVCHDTSNTDAPRITEPDIQMFNDESWKPIYFGVKGQGHESKNIVGIGICTLWVLASSSFDDVVWISGREASLSE